MKSLRLVSLALALALAGCGESPADQLATAKQELAERDFASARIVLISGLRDDPDNRDMLTLLADTQLRLGDAEGAQSTVEHLAKSGGDASGVIRFRAEIALLKGFPDEAIKLLATDRNSESFRIKGLALRAKEQPGDAIDMFESGMEVAPSARLGQSYGALLTAANDTPGAHRLAAQLWQVAPGSYEALMLKGDVALLESRADAAIAAFGQAAKAFPVRTEPLLAQVDALERAGRAKEATPLLNQAAQLAPDSRDVAAMQLRIESSLGQWDKVAEYLQSVETTLAPASAEGMLYAEALLRIGRPEQSRAMLARVIQQEPGNSYAQRLMAEAQLATNDSDGAFASLQDLITGRFTPRPLLELAITAGRAAGEPGVEAIEQRLVDPDYLAFERNILAGDAAAKRGDWAGAAASYRQLLGFEVSAEILGNLSYACSMSGDHDAAIGFADQALMLAAGQPSMLHAAAFARIAGNRDLAKAKSLLEQALALEPRNLEFVVRLKTLEAAAG